MVVCREKCVCMLTLPMPRLLSSIAKGLKDFCKASKPCHVDIHWIALIKYSDEYPYMPVIQSFISFFASLRIGKISHLQYKG